MGGGGVSGIRLSCLCRLGFYVPDRIAVSRGYDIVIIILICVFVLCFSEINVKVRFWFWNVRIRIVLGIR